MKKSMNIIGSLSSEGGGEQSLIDFSIKLVENGYNINLIPWDKVNNKWKKYVNVDFTFKNGIEKMTSDIPLFFYANDQIYEWCRGEDKIRYVVDNSSNIVIGINFVTGPLNKSQWLFDTKKLKLVTFLNNDKKLAWYKGKKEFRENVKLIQVPNVINTKKFTNNPIPSRKQNEPLVVCRISRGDNRKFVTAENCSYKGKNYLWQKKLNKEPDIVFYKKLADKFGDNIEFRFMQGSKELKECFNEDKRFKFYNWNEIPVNEFLSKCHVFLYRCSDRWDEQGPRVIQEALLSGLPCLVEPRDGFLDRIEHNTNGFFCIEYKDYEQSIQSFMCENFRYEMAAKSRHDAISRFDVSKWIRPVVDALFDDRPAEFVTKDIKYGGSAPTLLECESLKVFLEKHNIKRILECIQ